MAGGTYQLKAKAISRTPVTLLQIDIDTCTRAFGVAPCDASGVPCYNTYVTCRNRASYNRAVKTLEFVTVDAGTPFKQGERPYLAVIDYMPTEIKNSLTVSGRMKAALCDEPDTDYGK